MKNKSYFVDRIIALRGGDESQRSELMNLTMVDILNILSKERTAASTPVSVIPFEDEQPVPEPEAEEDFISIVKRFLFTSPD